MGKAITTKEWVIIMSIGFSYCGSIQGYEVGTHAIITQKTVNAASIKQSGVLKQQLGILSDEVLGGELSGGARYYIDIAGNQLIIRKNSNHAFDNMPPLSVLQDEQIRRSLSYEGWLMRGSIREDDICVLGQIWLSDKCDAPNNMVRVVHHFYDPVNDRAFTPPSEFEFLFNEEKSPNWALGTTDFKLDPPPENTARINHFTIRDAKEAMHRAVTGLSTGGSPDIAPDGSGGARAPIDDVEGESVRKAYWATTFRALGDVLHLIQDAAQPQHTRTVKLPKCIG